MSANIYLNLLFLYGVLCQGIVGTVSEKDIDESSDLVRRKRVISRVPGEDVPQHIPYIIEIREKGTANHCPGVILTRKIAISLIKCTLLNNRKYFVFSGSSHLTPTGSHSRNVNPDVSPHHIIDKRSLHGLHGTEDGISLIVVQPAFSTQSISFFHGTLHPGMLATVSGWGCDESGNFETQYPEYLRSITVPIIHNGECAAMYRSHFTITENEICTLDPTHRRYCTVKDGGAPLVVHVGGVPYLVGIYFWNGGVARRPKPDVFINLLGEYYFSWLRNNQYNLEALYP